MNIVYRGEQGLRVYSYLGFQFYNAYYMVEGRKRYAILGMKDANKYPYLTTIRECKEYIRSYWQRDIPK